MAVTCLGLSFQFINIKVPWGLDSALVAVGLMHLGSCAKKLENSELISRVLSLNVWEILILGIVETSVILLSPYINMRTANYGLWPLFFFNVSVACAIGISICKKLEHNRRGCKGILYLRHVGEKSIVYLCCNQLLIESIKGYIHIENTYLKGILLLFITCVTIEVICLAIYNTRLKCIIGK